MYKMKWLVVVAAVFLIALAKAEEEAEVTEEKEPIDKNTVVATSRLGAGDLTLPGSLVSLLANGGAVAAGILAVAAIALLVMPIFGLRLCSIIGHCDTPNYQAYSTSPNSVYDYPGYNQAGTFNNPSTKGGRWSTSDLF